MTSPLQPLADRLLAARADGVLPVVVFDVDSTLLTTQWRHHRILTDVATELQHPGLLEIARTASPSDFGWDLRGLLIRRGITDEDLLKAVRKGWSKRFFRSAYCELDVPYPHALELVKAVHEAGALVYYLTARPAGMAPGTVRCFQALGFPVLTHRTKLHLKADAQQVDHAFKADAMQAIASLQGRVVGTFENEPGNANLFAEAFPDAFNAWVDTVHKPTAPPLNDAVVTLDALGPLPASLLAATP